MKYKKFKIETDGTTAKTKVYIDGKQIGSIQRLEFSADVNNQFTKIMVERAVVGDDGLSKKKKFKIRDEKTQKMIETEKIITEPLFLERKEKEE